MILVERGGDTKLHKREFRENKIRETGESKHKGQLCGVSEWRAAGRRSGWMRMWDQEKEK